MHTDELDQFLMRSDPAGPLTSTEQQLLAEIAEQSAPAQKRRYARPVAVGAIVAILLGGGGLATAAANDIWAPWAQDPLIKVNYVLPSGKTCEYRLGDLQQAEDGVADVIRDALAGAEFDDSEVVAAAEYIGVTEDPRTDDNAYFTGVIWAIQLRINQALAAHDLSAESYDDLSGEAICS